MIEIIYKDENVVTEEKSECTLPKNIRQVGEQHGSIRIYLEDFAYTYLMKTAAVNPEKGKLCLLLGGEKEKDGQPVLFIRSAFWLDQMEVDAEHIRFQDSEWSVAAGVMEKNFPDQEILGWSLMLGGCGLEPSPLITKTHLNHFSGVNRVFFFIDPAEKEEAFFLYDNNALTKQGGYYIYYEENKPMQEYMISHNPVVEGRVGEPTDRVVQDFRKAVDRKQHSPVKLVGQAVRVAAAACFVFAVAAVVQYVSKNPDRRAAQTAVSTAEETGVGFEASQGLYSQEGLLGQAGQDAGTSSSSKTTDESGFTGESGSPDIQAEAAENSTPAGADVAITGGNPGETTSQETVAANAGAEKGNGEESGKAAVEQGSPGQSETQNNTAAEAAAEGGTQAPAGNGDTENPGNTPAPSGETDGSDPDSTQSASEKTDGGTQAPSGKSDEGSPDSTPDSTDKTKTDSAAASGKGAYAAYRVQKGDTITSIASRYYGSLAKISEICALNNLESQDLIYEGQVILLP